MQKQHTKLIFSETVLLFGLKDDYRYFRYMRHFKWLFVRELCAQCI